MPSFASSRADKSGRNRAPLANASGRPTPPLLRSRDCLTRAHDSDAKIDHLEGSTGYVENVAVAHENAVATLGLESYADTLNGLQTYDWLAVHVRFHARLLRCLKVETGKATVVALRAS